MSYRIRSGRSQRGMSLLETVCTLTIMGSVSATALPHLTDMSTQARQSVVMSLGGSLTSASALMHMKCATTAHCNLSEGTATVSLSDGPVAMWRGYPQGGAPEGIEHALQTSGFAVAYGPGRTSFEKVGAPEPQRCVAHYTSPATDGGLPNIEVDTTGC